MKVASSNRCIDLKCIRKTWKSMYEKMYDCKWSKKPDLCNVPSSLHTAQKKWRLGSLVLIGVKTKQRINCKKTLQTNPVFFDLPTIRLTCSKERKWNARSKYWRIRNLNKGMKMFLVNEFLQPNRRQSVHFSWSCKQIRRYL